MKKTNLNRKILRNITLTEFTQTLKKNNEMATMAIIHCGSMQKTKILTTKWPDFKSGKVYDVLHNGIIA